ncbi:hypothetical protein KAU18_01825, partial [Candidatus Bathyarchaeota archaeon]|nr:hypothetical protein [Candidatus Bathyarchaeota archaeon]
RYTNELKTLSREMGVSYREVPQRLRSENEKSQELKAENEKLQREIQINQRTVRHELGQKKTTLEQLNEFVHVRDELKKWNFDIQNLVDTRNLLENVEKLGHDPKAVVETFSKHQLVETNLKTLQKQEQELSETMKNQRMENESLQETLDDNRELVDEVEQLKHHNIGPQTVVDLLKTAIKIGAEHGLTEPEAIEKFMKDTKTHYDPILGHEERLDTLNAIINMVEKKLAQKEEENRSLTEIVDQRREALDCLQTIQNLGVKDEELVEWKNILEENRYDVAGFREEINKLNGIERLAEEKTRRVRDLEYRIEQLTTVRTFTENEAIGAREDLANRFNELSQTVQKEIDKVNDLMNRFEEDFTSEDTGYLARSKAIIEDTHGKVSSLLIKTEEKWREDVDRLNEDTDRIVENVDFILQNAYKGGKIVGRFHSLEPINKLISGETQPYFQTVLAVFTLMTYIMKWFDDNNKMSLIEPGNKIIDHLSRELGAANP